MRKFIRLCTLNMCRGSFVKKTEKEKEHYLIMVFGASPLLSRLSTCKDNNLDIQW